MTDNKSYPTSHTKLISWVLAGVMIPLIAAAMPWLIGTIIPSKELLFTFQGPIEAKKAVALSVDVENNGQGVETDIEVWLPLHIISHMKVTTTKSGQVKTENVEPTVSIETDVPSTIETEGSNIRIVRIKSLRPSERVQITVLAYGGKTIVSKYELEKMRVVSSQTVGSYDGPNDFVEYMYKVGTWLFVVFFLIAYAWATYFESFMPKRKKEEYLMKQIDKLEK